MSGIINSSISPLQPSLGVPNPQESQEKNATAPPSPKEVISEQAQKIKLVTPPSSSSLPSKEITQRAKLDPGIADATSGILQPEKETLTEDLTKSEFLDPQALKKLGEIETYIDNQIQKYEGWQKTAMKTVKVALGAIALGLILTAAFYLSPIIFAALVMIPTAFVTILTLGLTGVSVEWATFASIDFGKLAYSSASLKVAALANTSIAVGVALPIAIAGGGTYLFAKHKIQKFQGLNELVKSIKQQGNYKDFTTEQLKKLESLIFESDQDTSKKVKELEKKATKEKQKTAKLQKSQEQTAAKKAAEEAEVNRKQKEAIRNVKNLLSGSS